MPVLRELVLGGEPAAWRRLGFAVDRSGRIGLDGVTLTFDPERAPGIAAWTVEGVVPGERDGLDFRASAGGAPRGRHVIGARAVDHVVAATPDPARTRAALADAGLEPRRVRDAGDTTQSFYVLDTALLELVGPLGEPGPARLWGLAVVVGDLERAARAAGGALGAARDAVQPGRRIATVREEAGLGVPLALMTPR